MKSQERRRRTFTLRGYARHRKARGLPGGSLAAVQKALATGRIAVDDDGRIDVAAADEAWSANTDERYQPDDPAACTPKTPTEERTRARGGTALVTEDGETFTLASERALRERAERRLKELEFRKRSGDLVAVERVTALNFRVARQIRSRLEAIPDRLADSLAAESDPQAIDERLRGEIRRTLELLGADPSGAGDLDLEDGTGEHDGKQTTLDLGNDDGGGGG